MRSAEAAGKDENGGPGICTRKGFTGRLLVVCSLTLGLLGGASAPGSEHDESWDELLRLLARRATLYERAALGFSCEETVLRGRFSTRSGENKREVEEHYDYLYEGNPTEGFKEVRMRLSPGGERNRPKIVELDLDVPEAYGWALLFTEQRRPHFRLEMIGEERLGFRLAAVIRFAGTKPYERGREIEEWSGRVWVDRETGNFLKVEASPHDQAERLARQNAEWFKSVRLGGIPLRRRPRGYRYGLLFTVEKLGLTFPGEAELRLFHLSPQGEEEVRERIAQRFRNYLFFNVSSDEEFLDEKTLQEKNASP